MELSAEKAEQLAELEPKEKKRKTKKAKRQEEEEEEPSRAAALNNAVQVSCHWQPEGTALVGFTIL